MSANNKISLAMSLKGADIPDSDFNADDLAEGTAHEMEHTDDPEVAKAIAKPHLKEHSNYYKVLPHAEKVMKSAKVSGTNWLSKLKGMMK